MKQNLSIQLKAAFLLTVFSLNIVVGFACSVGIGMGFNAHHHDAEMMMDNSSHHHAMQANASQHHDEMNTENSKGDDDNCCKDKVTNLTTADKSLPQSYSALINPVFLTSFISTFYQADVFISYAENTSSKHFVRSSPPTIPDIRIAIQSFLI